MPEKIVSKLNTFKRDLQELPSLTVVRKHLIYGDCYALTSNQYFGLRSEVAEHFGLHPNEILVVGSAKLGFSIAPHKRFRSFCDDSDIDVVLVSPMLFDKIWKSVFAYASEGSYWEREQDFKNYLFQGWIRPDKLPPSKMFPICQDWWEFFRRLTQSGRYGYFKISGALYKSWYYLESYQDICVQVCKQALGD